MTAQKISIKFSYNWNNKLNNIVFTTIRQSSFLFAVGSTYVLYLNSIIIGKGEILDKKTMRLADVPEYIFWQDTGFSKGETMRLIQRIYKVAAKDIDDFVVDIIFIKKLPKPDKTGSPLLP